MGGGMTEKGKNDPEIQREKEEGYRHELHDMHTVSESGHQREL